MLVWFGLPDPLGNSAKISDNDPEKERTSAILSALPAGKPWSAADKIPPRGALSHLSA
ncbi:hypothetical protein GCM10010520_63960 [Rhizobium viscosum]